MEEGVELFIWMVGILELSDGLDFDGVVFWELVNEIEEYVEA